METLFLVYSIIFGLIIGSFLNVCIYRIPREESISYPPSHCTKCGYKLRWYDLIPVVSYILLKGRCRKCGEKISIIYPLIEVFTGLLFGVLYIKFNLSIEFFKFVSFFCIMIVIAMIDFFTTDVYFSTIVTGTIIGVTFIVIEKIYLHNKIMDNLLGAIVGAGVIWIIYIITKAMGEGDIEICFVCGLFLGLKSTILMLVLSFILGGIIGVLLIALKIKSRKDYIPFGPFIALSAIISVLFNEFIFNWYISLF